MRIFLKCLIEAKMAKNSIFKFFIVSDVSVVGMNLMTVLEPQCFLNLSRTGKYSSVSGRVDQQHDVPILPIAKFQ